MPTVTLAKFSAVFVWIIHNFPDWLLKITSPRLNGVVVFRKVSLNDIFTSSAVALTSSRRSRPKSRAS